MPTPLPAMAGRSPLIPGKARVLVCMTSSSSSAVRSIVAEPPLFAVSLDLDNAGVERLEEWRESEREATTCTSSRSAVVGNSAYSQASSRMSSVFSARLMLRMASRHLPCLV